MTESLWLVNISGSDDVNSNLPEIEKLLGRLRIEYTEILKKNQIFCNNLGLNLEIIYILGGFIIFVCLTG